MQTESPPESGLSAHAGVYPLYVMLPIFALIGLMALSSELTADRKMFKLEEGSQAVVPHSPAEFEDILGGFDPFPPADAKGNYPTPPPPLSEDIFPCTQCHEDPEDDDPERRELEMEHTNIKLNHGDKSRWCLDCHSFENRDMLHLSGGELIPFTESQRLCGQCHGTIYRDWRLGIHGKRTGYWDGKKRYLLCVVCHWPHEPHFKPLKPLPPPVRPQFLRPQDRPAVDETQPAEEH